MRESFSGRLGCVKFMVFHTGFGKHLSANDLFFLIAGYFKTDIQ